MLLAAMCALAAVCWPSYSTHGLWAARDDQHAPTLVRRVKGRDVLTASPAYGRRRTKSAHIGKTCAYIAGDELGVLAQRQHGAPDVLRRRRGFFAEVAEGIDRDGAGPLVLEFKSGPHLLSGVLVRLARNAHNTRLPTYLPACTRRPISGVSIVRG
jgi:hypothetical protein